MYQREALKCGNFYNIFSPENGKEQFFYSDENYFFFLKKFSETVLPIAELYGYCLLPNQFHLLIKIKDEKSVFEYLKMNGNFPEETVTLDSIKTLSAGEGMANLDIFGMHISRLFSTFFNSYSKAINEQQKKRGSLFEKGFKIKHLESTADLKQCLLNMHNSSLQNKLVTKVEDWKFSSYEALSTDKATKLKRDEAMSWFENKEDFLNCQHQKIEYSQTI